MYVIKNALFSFMILFTMTVLANMIFFYYYYCTCYADLHNLFIGKGLYLVDCYLSENCNEL